MSQGETLITILLAVIAYFLYQIAKQLSYMTGRRFKIRLPKFGHTPTLPKRKREEEKLTN